MLNPDARRIELTLGPNEYEIVPPLFFTLVIVSFFSLSVSPSKTKVKPLNISAGFIQVSFFCWLLAPLSKIVDIKLSVVVVWFPSLWTAPQFVEEFPRQL